MNDLARIVQIMTAAAERQAGLTPAQLLQRDLQQAADFEAWRREVDAVEGIFTQPVPYATNGSGKLRHLSPATAESAPTPCAVNRGSGVTAERDPQPDADAFSFSPACRELAAHFMPGADALSVDYFAQYLSDCATEYLELREEMK